MKYTKIYLLSVLKYQRVAYIISFGVNKCLKNVYKIVHHCKSVLSSRCTSGVLISKTTACVSVYF